MAHHARLTTEVAGVRRSSVSALLKARDTTFLLVRVVTTTRRPHLRAPRRTENLA